MTAPVSEFYQNLSPKDAERALELYALLVQGPLDTTEIQSQTDWSKAKIYKAVQVLRDMLAEIGETSSVTAKPQGRGLPWVYKLEYGEGIADGEWLKNRVGYAERFILTIGNVFESAVNALAVDTMEGTKARIIHLHLKRAKEELALTSVNGALYR